MNKEVLNRIFEIYTDNFDFFNRSAKLKDNCEFYKWVLAYDFKSKVDAAILAGNDMIAEKIKELGSKDISENLIQNGYEEGLTGLAKCAEYEPDTVRDMLRSLIEDDGGNLEARQEKIARFVNACNLLKEKHFPKSRLYEMNQRAAMAFLALYDPEKYYFYKATEAYRFADCVEFYDSWGYGTSMKLDVYYRMCDEIAEELKQNNAMLELVERRKELHKGGKYHPEKSLHADSSLHLYVFDIIYCIANKEYNTQRRLFPEIQHSFSSKKEMNEYLAKKEKAQNIYNQYLEAVRQAELLKDAKDELDKIFTAGTKVVHSVFGEGIVAGTDGWIARIDFHTEGLKSIEMGTAISKNIIKSEPDATDWMKKYGAVIGKEPLVYDQIRTYESNLEKLSEYLD